MEDETYYEDLMAIQDALKEEEEAESWKTENDSTTFMKPLNCSKCGKAFTILSSLKAHEKTHGAKTQFSCPKCNKKFTQKCNLKTHERIHTGDKPFSCSQCDYKCSTSSNLKRHERSHTNCSKEARNS